VAKKRASRAATRSYSMPELSGLYGKPPFEYREARQLLVEFRTDPRVLRQLVPPPLTPNKDAKVFVSTADFLCSGFGRYLEAHVFTHATFQRRLVNFSIYLILDNDVAIGAGREIWGFPKKLGRLTLEMKDDIVSTTVERGGRTIIDAAVVHRAPLHSERIAFGTAGHRPADFDDAHQHRHARRLQRRRDARFRLLAGRSARNDPDQGSHRRVLSQESVHSRRRRSRPRLPRLIMRLAAGDVDHHSAARDADVNE
jgi:hypothetical protein